MDFGSLLYRPLPDTYGRMRLFNLDVSFGGDVEYIPLHLLAAAILGRDTYALRRETLFDRTKTQVCSPVKDGSIVYLFPVLIPGGHWRQL